MGKKEDIVRLGRQLFGHTLVLIKQLIVLFFGKT